MCSIDDGETADVYLSTLHRARRDHQCEECGRWINRGERYERIKMLYDGTWSTYATCGHCHALGEWFRVVCGGYLVGGLRIDLEHHWDEYGWEDRLALGRLTHALGRRWQTRAGDGLYPVDTVAQWVASSKVLRRVVAA